MPENMNKIGTIYCPEAFDQDVVLSEVIFGLQNFAQQVFPDIEFDYVDAWAIPDREIVGVSFEDGCPILAEDLEWLSVFIFNKAVKLESQETWQFYNGAPISQDVN